MDAVIDQCSLFSLYLESMCSNKITGEEICLSKATGFIYKYQSQCYLVTNWHVLAGRNAIDLSPLDKTNSALPEKVKLFFPINGEIDSFIERDFLLKNGNCYLWRQHIQKNMVDVAILPIDIPQDSAIYSISNINLSRGLNGFPPGVFIGQDVFILGFPRGIRSGGKLPIWKRASIATEPYMPVENNSYKILVDTATREGMSGSPVIIASRPDANVKFDQSKQEVAIRPYKLFLGIYSGRIVGEDEFAAQLGIVWKCNAIQEIIENGIIYCDNF